MGAAKCERAQADGRGALTAQQPTCAASPGDSCSCRQQLHAHVLEVGAHEGAQLGKPHVRWQRQDAQLLVAAGLQPGKRGGRGAVTKCRCMLRMQIELVVQAQAGRPQQQRHIGQGVASSSREASGPSFQPAFRTPATPTSLSIHPPGGQLRLLRQVPVPPMPQARSLS